MRIGLWINKLLDNEIKQAAWKRRKSIRKLCAEIASAPALNAMNSEGFWFQFQWNQTDVRSAHRTSNLVLASIKTSIKGNRIDDSDFMEYQWLATRIHRYSRSDLEIWREESI